MTKREAKRRPPEKKRNLRPIRFKGFDWTELGQIFDISCGSDDSMWAFIIKERLWRAASISCHHEPGDYRLAKWQIKQARRYFEKVSECDHHYDSKVWHEIAVIKDDEMFLKWVSAFMESAWT